MVVLRFKNFAIFVSDRREGYLPSPIVSHIISQHIPCARSQEFQHHCSRYIYTYRANPSTWHPIVICGVIRPPQS
jgi:hypothetical protein